MSKVWMVTGSSRGLGRNLVETLLENGDIVVATARTVGSLDPLRARYGERILPVRHDVTVAEQADEAVAAALDAFGRVDVVVNNAGCGFIGAFEEMTADAFARQIDANFYGVVHTTRAVVPVLRRQQAGHVIQISTIGGRFANPGLSGYQAAKFAVEGFSESLAQELAPLGVRVTILELGAFRTDWYGSSMAYADPIPDYDRSVGMIRAYVQANADAMPGDPRKAAQVIRDLADLADPPLRLVLGADALAIARNGYKRNLDDLERWSGLSESTDLPDAQVPGHQPVS